MNIVSIWKVCRMWERILTSMPVIAGAIVLFGAFCAALIVFEKRGQERKAAFQISRSSFSYKKNVPLRNSTSPARIYPKRSYSFSADGFCENASRRTAV